MWIVKVQKIYLSNIFIFHGGALYGLYHINDIMNIILVNQNKPVLHENMERMQNAS